MKFNEQVLPIIFDSLAEGLLLVNKKGIIALTNSQTEVLFGYEDQELIGQALEVLLPNSVKSIHKKYRDSYFAAPKKRSMGKGLDLQGRKKDGSTFPIEVSLNHMKIDDEPYVIALLTDISERKAIDDSLRELNETLEARVEERTRALNESQMLYSTIARNFPNGIISVFDKDLNYIFVEGKELFKLGITSDDLVGTSYAKRLPTHLKEEIEAKLMSVFEGEVSSFDVENEGAFYRIDAVPLNTSSDKPTTQVLVVEHNVTDQKEAERKILNSLIKEKELNELKTRFLSMASHEFKTPLSSILSSSELMESYVAVEKYEKLDRHINRIKKSVSNLTGILNDFLSLTTLESGELSLNDERIDLRVFLKSIIDEFNLLKSDDLNIVSYFKGNHQFTSDSKALGHIVNNVLSNAIKYSPSGGTVNIDVSVDASKLSIVVTDQGIGIPKEELTKISNRFYRAANALNIDGTGLGLNIVKKYIEYLQGSFDIQSEEGVGTTITVNLPNIK